MTYTVSGSQEQSGTYNKSSLAGDKDVQYMIPGFEFEPEVKFMDMPIEMREFAFTSAKKGLKLLHDQKVKFAKGVAEYIKKEFDEKFKGVWNVVVGHSFGFYGSYHSEAIILFQIRNFNFLIFRFG